MTHGTDYSFLLVIQITVWMQEFFIFFTIALRNIIRGVTLGGGMRSPCVLVICVLSVQNTHLDLSVSDAKLWMKCFFHRWMNGEKD